MTQAATLALVAVAITAGVYGVVAMIVKADDVGLHFAKRGGALAVVGRGLVKGVPVVMRALSVIGTAAMIWVGGGILLHGVEVLGWPAPAHWLHHVSETAGHAIPGVGPAVTWALYALGSGVVGLVVGGVIAAVVHQIGRARGSH